MGQSTLVEIDDARRMVIASAHTLPAEALTLGPPVLGRVLAEDVVATEAVPAFDNSAMDGFAVRARDLGGAAGAGAGAAAVTLRLVGESRAGVPAPRPLAAGEAIAISTGAQLPAGADSVVRLEDTRSEDGHVEVRCTPAVGQNVRRAGEDVEPGATVLRSGTELGPAELGVLGSLGHARVLCTRRPEVAVLVTGEELLGADEPMRPGAVRDSSSLTLPALVVQSGASVVHLARCGDDPAQTRAAIAGALNAVDVTVVAGGVSVGAHDHVRDALTELGATCVFWGLALKPGRPAWFGTAGSTLVFALPGNPVSAIVTFVLLVRPALHALLGLRRPHRATSATIDSDYQKTPGRAHALRCTLALRDDGWHAQPTGPQGSHVLTSMLDADALAIVPSASSGVRAGERVAIEPLREWVGM